MDDREFNRLINGALNHPVITLRFSRLVTALRVVVAAGGQQTAEALRQHCEMRTRQDEEVWDDR